MGWGFVTRSNMNIFSGKAWNNGTLFLAYLYIVSIAF